MEGISFAFDWEVRLMEALQSHLGSAGAAAASAASMFGEELVLIAVLGFLYWCWDKKAGQRVGLNIIAGLVLNPMIKNAALRRRPYFDHEGIRCLRPVDADADIYDIAAQGYSFPSGHSMNALILYGSLPWALYGQHAAMESPSERPEAARGHANRKNPAAERILKILAVLLPLLVGISRVLVGVHYPTDVLTGWACGAAVIFAVSYLQSRIRRQGLLRLILFLLACPGILYCRTSDYFTAMGIFAGFILAVPFEERFVQFSPTRQPVRILLRMAGGFALYFTLNTLLKLPFSPEFLAQASLPAMLVRSLRYLVVVFVLLGVYPKLFRKFPAESPSHPALAEEKKRSGRSA